MVSVPRVRRSLVAALGSLALAATVLIPIGGVASAATASSACPTFESGPAECNLFITAPDTVLTFQTFTVQVAVVPGEGSPLANSDPCAPVKVTLSVSLGEATPTTYMATASAGIATFNISVPLDGLYDLQATAPSTATCSYSDGSGNFTAVFIPQTQPIAPCPDFVSCLQTFDLTGSAATLFADTGQFTAQFGPGTLSGCGGGPLEANGMLTFSYSGTSTKTIVFALASSLVTKGIGLFNICWSSPTAFVPLGGGAPVNSGLLPACGKNATGPCVLFKKSNQNNVGFFGVLAPPGDPAAYPR